ncbi:hypothetical protein [Streptomyces sp. NPDC050504]|uniref:hypothetical protein n=1 Tax=Streptomyces sp. NPDC050504 TaxID=3365618 RepID=UPI00379D1C91
MVRKTTARLRWARLAGLCAAVVVTADGCGLIPLPSVDDASPEELFGTWAGGGGSVVALEADGDAEARQLRGEEWSYDEGWAMTGTGTWRLIEGGDGQTLAGAPAVEVSVSKVTRMKDWPAADALGHARSPLRGYTWRFGMDRTDEGLKPYYLAGDPDTAFLYYLHRMQPG